MFESWKALVLAACVLMSSASAYAQRATEGKELPSPQMLDRYGLKMAWWGQADMDPLNDRVRYVTIDEQVVVVQSTKGTVTAFEHDSGRRLWSALYGRPNQPSYAVAINDQLVVVPVGMRMYAVEKFSGRLVWQVLLPSHPSTSPSMDANRIYIGSLNGTLYAYNLKKVRDIFQQGYDERWSFLSLDWRYMAGKRIVTAPVSNDRNIAFASYDGLMYSVEADNHRLRFQFEPDYPISAPLGFSENVLIAVTDGFKVYSIDSDNGNLLWEYAAGTPIHQAPHIIGQQLFLVTDDGTMLCISKSTHEHFWVREKVNQFLAATNTLVYASDDVGNVLLLSREDGSLIGTLPLRQYTFRPDNGRTDRLFMVTENGRLICIHEQGADYPLYHQFPDRRPILPEFAPDEPAPKAEAEPGTGTPSKFFPDAGAQK